MAMMGSSIDPRMFVNDYSGFTNAAAIQAAGMLDFGNQIGGAIKDYQKEQKDSKNMLKAGEAQIKAAAALFPSQAPMFESLANDLRNEDTPLSERAAIASQVADLISMSVGEKRYQTERGYKERDQVLAESQNTRQNTLFNQQSAATQLAIQDAQAKRDAERFNAPANLAAAIKKASQISDFPMPYKGTDLEAAFDQTPEVQNAMTALITSLLPEKQKWELKNLPATINGQPGEIPALFNDSGNIVPLGMNDGMVLPPKQGGTIAPPPEDIATNEGAVLPANESKLVGEGTSTDGKPIEIWNYQGQNYTAPKKAGPASTGVDIQLGRNMVSPKQTPGEVLQITREGDMDKSLSGIRDEGLVQAQTIGAMEDASKLLDSVETGFTKDTQMRVKRAFGMDVKDAEQLQVIVGKFVMDNIALTKGAISEKEMAYFKDELSPGMGKTTEGNKKIIEFKIKYAKRAKEIGEFITAAQAAGKSPFEIKSAVDSYLESNTLVGGGKGAAQVDPNTESSNRIRSKKVQQ
jgi:hypothetical protein